MEYDDDVERGALEMIKRLVVHPVSYL